MCNPLKSGVHCVSHTFYQFRLKWGGWTDEGWKQFPAGLMSSLTSPLNPNSFPPCKGSWKHTSHTDRLHAHLYLRSSSSAGHQKQMMIKLGLHGRNAPCHVLGLTSRRSRFQLDLSKSTCNSKATGVRFRHLKHNLPTTLTQKTADPLLEALAMPKDTLCVWMRRAWTNVE